VPILSENLSKGTSGGPKLHGILVTPIGERERENKIRSLNLIIFRIRLNLIKFNHLAILNLIGPLT
jgi:hypothetical protein